MSCCHLYEFAAGSESVFAIDVTSIRFGPGVLREVGHDAVAFGLKRVALFTDRRVAGLEAVHTVSAALRAAGIDVAVYDDVHVEPTDGSFVEASRFAAEGRFDGFVSVGGGSTIDTCKAANLYATYPSDFLAYVNAPIGGGLPVPGRLKPHIACPTTSGTGSESTGIAIFDLVSAHLKTGIASRALRPTLALIDPDVTRTLPSMVVAASGFDVLSHALESYTARPFTRRVAPATPGARPMGQGANPWSDVGCVEALRLTGEFIVRAVHDAADTEARSGMMFAATLAGVAFGNSGVHLPHAMAYAVAGGIRDYRPEGYPQDEPICPHGISVIVNAPSVFRYTGPTDAERHLRAAELLGADVRGVDASAAGDVLADTIVGMMRQTAMPNGTSGLGYTESDAAALARGALAQERLLVNAPVPVDGDVLKQLFGKGATYW